MGAFAYSEEEGTYSAKQYPDDIPEEVNQESLDELIAIQQGITAELHHAKIGQTLRIVIDRVEGDYHIWRTEADSPEVDPEFLLKCDDKEYTLGSFDLALF